MKIYEVAYEKRIKGDSDWNRRQYIAAGIVTGALNEALLVAEKALLDTMGEDFVHFEWRVLYAKLLAEAP